MNDYGILSDSETTRKIWDRVTGVSGITKAAEASLAEYIDGEAQSIKAYESIARLICQSYKSTVCAILRDEKRHIRTLQALYYMSTGKKYEIPAMCSVKQDVSESLRSRYNDELEASGKYALAAENSSKAAAEAFSEMSRDEVRHASMLLKVMEYILD